ncbi:hypothetical protein F4818DRAFT_444575 [Hypoxylon cercidicola]|nr:hypothetical protein F4818DRAFT_444575 [Hypoxylon cercidicola]
MGSPISSFAILNARAGGTIAIIRVLLALAPVALPAAYLVFLKRELAKHTIADVYTSPPDPLPFPSSSLSPSTTTGEDEDEIIPSAVLASPDKFVVSRERVTSHAVPIASLRPDLVADPDGLLLEAYLRATMQAFSWTPQALLMARMGSSFDDPTGAFARSFQTPYLSACAFRPGDRVCGAYVVRERRGDERAVLELAPPQGWRGPAVKGVLRVGFEREGDDNVRFVHETVLWRAVGEKETFLEGRMGRWMQGLLTGWLVVKGVEAVTG